MKGDYLSYKRASTVSLLGLLIQSAAALGLLIYGVNTGRDHATLTASILVAIGVPVWVTLLILFDQHRRERMEAMEAEQMSASDAAAASAFESGGEDLRVAARRLANVQRWLLPIMSIAVAATLISVGLFRAPTGFNLTDPDAFEAPTGGVSGWAIALGLGMAVVGFVFARFAAGMGKQEVWGALRAGSSQAVVAALSGLLIGAAYFLSAAFGSEWLLRQLPAIFPIAMVVLGVEVILNLVLDLYRPRKPGEDPRPAFDSRLLGFVAAPDRIAESVGEALSYQFGIDVTGSWFYRLVSRSVMLLLVLAVLVGWGMTALVVIEPHQRGLVLTFGRLSKPVYSFGQRDDERAVTTWWADNPEETVQVTEIGPGLHVKWPWPISQVVIPEYDVTNADGQAEVLHTTTGVRRVQFGTGDAQPDKAILWNESHTNAVRNTIVQPARRDQRTGSGVDIALLALEIPMHYTVDDVVLYESVAAPEDRDRLLELLGDRTVMMYMSSKGVLDVMGANRADLAGEVLGAIRHAYEPLNAGFGPGIDIGFLGVQGVHPPKDVAPSFERVIMARQNREAKVEEARRDQIRELASVAGNVELARNITDRLSAIDRIPEGDERAEARLEVQRLLETAGGEAGAELSSARADRWSVAMGARGDAAEFLGQATAYAAAPALYRSQVYFDALLEVMKNARVYVLPDKDKLEDLKVRLELQDRDRGTTTFDIEAGAEGQ